MHFSEITKLLFRKERRTLLCSLKEDLNKTVSAKGGRDGQI